MQQQQLMNRSLEAGRRLGPVSACFALLLVTTLPASADWPGFGGPAGDFVVDGSSLAESWPEAGPAKLWEHPFGGGYGTIAADGDRLYAMYRIPSKDLEGRKDGHGQEAIVALAADSGEEVWRHIYDAPVNPTARTHDLSWGRGPNSTPVIVDDRVCVFGFTARVHCLGAKTGKVLWSNDLRKERGVRMPYFGHAASPLRYKDSLIVLAGGVMAFDLDNGELKWENREITESYATPIVVQLAGRDQLVAALAGEIAGLDPTTGKLLWRHEHANQYKTNLTAPVALDKERVFVSAAWVGSRGLAVSADGVKELWHNPKMQVAHSNAVRVGDWIYASSGVEVDFLTAINVDNGEIAWKKRGLAQSNLLYLGGDRFLLLDEDGVLALATLTPEDMTLHHKYQLFESRSWSTPTLIGSRLYVRNREKIVALELGEPPPAERTPGEAAAGR